MNNTTNSWEKKFDKFWDKNGSQLSSDDYEKTKTFFRTLLHDTEIAAREKMVEILDGVIAAYPEDVFIPTTEEWMREVHEFALSKEHTLDAISADIIRRAAKRIKKDVLSSLTKE